MKLNELVICKRENADFDNLGKLDFCGVYIIYDSANNDEIVYVGSAYVQSIKVRLKQYLCRGSNNTILQAMIRIDEDIKSINDKKKQKDTAIEKIKKFKILAIEHKDLEYNIIKESTPKYNKAGNKK